MTKNVAIIGANGQIARLVENDILNNDKDVHLTLFLRNASRLDSLKDNPQVTIIDGDANDPEDLRKAIKGKTSSLQHLLTMVPVLRLLKMLSRSWMKKV